MNKSFTIRFNLPNAFIAFGMLVLMWVPLLFAAEGEEGYGNLTVLKIDASGKDDEEFILRVNKSASKYKDNEVGSVVKGMIASCDLLVVYYSGSYYGTKEQNLLIDMQKIREKNQKNGKTFFLDESEIGGKSQVEVAVAFTDKVGSGIRFNECIVRRESDFERVLKDATDSGVKRVIWISDNSVLANSFSSMLGKKWIPILPAKAKPEFRESGRK